MIKVSEIRKNVLLARFDSRYLCAATMMRMQEFYESPINRIRGHYFTLEGIMDAYAADKGEFIYRDGSYIYKGERNFTYTLEWEGFNLPGNMVTGFYELFDCKGLLDKEKLLYSALCPFIKSGKPFYLIATSMDEYLGHELAHAYYYLYSDYREEMINNLSLFGRRKKMSSCILDSSGYSAGVVNDEIQAYMATGTPKSINADVGFKARQFETIPFRRVFRAFDKKQRGV
jgi:hypothetical protein